RHQRILRIVDRGALRIVLRSGINAGPARRALARTPAGRVRDQAPRIDGIDRNVRLRGGDDRGLKLRIVLHARLGEPAGKVDERLLFRQGGQLLYRVLDGLELAVRIEDIELGFVGDEGSARVLFIIVARIGGSGQFRHFADGKVLDDIPQ